MSSLLLPLLFLTPLISADLQTFTFIPNTTDTKCGNLPFGCGNNALCSYDPQYQRSYCCEIGNNGICQTFGNKASCEGSNNTPTENQILCDRLGSQWCCNSNRETCTERGDNINLCWASFDNPFKTVNLTKYTEIVVSLESASPSASTIPIDTSSLFQALSPSSTVPTSSSQSSDSTPSPSSSSPPTDDSPSSGGLSGGAIGGIVVGVVALFAIIGGLVWFLLKRRKNKQTTETLEKQYDTSYYAKNAELPATETQQFGASYYAKNAELPATAYVPDGPPPGVMEGRPVELDAGEHGR